MPPPHQTDLKLKEYDFAIVQFKNFLYLCITSTCHDFAPSLYTVHTHTPYIEVYIEPRHNSRLKLQECECAVSDFPAVDE